MIEYSIDEGQKLVMARMTGKTSMVELATHISNLAKDPRFQPDFNLLFEIDPDATFAILANESEFKGLLKCWTERRKGVKWAVWAPPGMAHTHVQFALGMLDQHHVHMRLFENEKSALDWLSEAG